MEYMRIDHLKTIQSKVFIYVNGEKTVETKLITYYQQSSEKNLVAIDPNLHFDLLYNDLCKKSSEADLKLLHDFIDQFLLQQLNCSSSSSEKDSYNYRF